MESEDFGFGDIGEVSDKFDRAFVLVEIEGQFILATHSELIFGIFDLALIVVIFQETSD